MADFPRAKRPCAECPWRRDTDPGQFSACRYDALAATSGRPGSEAHFGAPMFACHKAPEGREYACAGWLAVAGWDHLGLRLRAVVGDIPPEAFAPGPDWPPLFDSYAEMAATQGGAE